MLVGRDAGVPLAHGDALGALRGTLQYTQSLCGLLVQSLRCYAHFHRILRFPHSCPPISLQTQSFPYLVRNRRIQGRYLPDLAATAASMPINLLNELVIPLLKRLSHGAGGYIQESGKLGDGQPHARASFRVGLIGCLASS